MFARLYVSITIKNVQRDMHQTLNTYYLRGECYWGQEVRKTLSPLLWANTVLLFENKNSLNDIFERYSYIFHLSD